MQKISGKSVASGPLRSVLSKQCWSGSGHTPFSTGWVVAAPLNALYQSSSPKFHAEEILRACHMHLCSSRVLSQEPSPIRTSSGAGGRSWLWTLRSSRSTWSPRSPRSGRPWWAQSLHCSRYFAHDSLNSKERLKCVFFWPSLFFFFFPFHVLISFYVFIQNTCIIDIQSGKSSSSSLFFGGCVCALSYKKGSVMFCISICNRGSSAF